MRPFLLFAFLSYQNSFYIEPAMLLKENLVKSSRTTWVQRSYTNEGTLNSTTLVNLPFPKDATRPTRDLLSAFVARIGCHQDHSGIKE